MKKIFSIMFATILLCGCFSDARSPKDVVIANYRAMAEEDIDEYLITVMGPRFDIANTLLSEFFENYDVAYTIDTIELLSIVGDNAEVKTVVTALDKGGPNKFHDNRTTVFHKLKKDNGFWKIYFSETAKLEYIGNAPGVKGVIAEKSSKDTTR